MEGFSISDASSGEVWYMEFIGKGGYGKGALWVALRLPEGHVMAHANQARLGIRSGSGSGSGTGLELGSGSGSGLILMGTPTRHGPPEMHWAAA
jgi:hypothetical protein